MEFTFCAITSLPFGANSEEILYEKKWCLSIHRGRILVKMGENWEDGEMHVFCTFWISWIRIKKFEIITVLRKGNIKLVSIFKKFNSINVASFCSSAKMTVQEKPSGLFWLGIMDKYWPINYPIIFVLRDYG